MASLAINCLCLALIILTADPASASRKLTERSMTERHERWMARYGRVYNDEAERERRFKIFKTNVELIESFNAAGGCKFRLGANQFADLLNEEFNEVCSGFRPPLVTAVTAAQGFAHANVTDVPRSVDWRTRGAVTPVKHQGHCGSCWAYSAVASMEGLTKIKTGKLVSLSEQELIDRDTDGENRGCRGGNMGTAFEFAVRNEGLSSSADYPADPSTRAATIRGYEYVPANDEAALAKAVSVQPVSVAIDATSYAMQLYSGGVFTGYCGTDLNHAVTVVGYGTESDGTKYWIVKNSWGSSWGEDGYMRIERDVDAEEGLCGIAMHATYPTA